MTYEIEKKEDSVKLTVTHVNGVTGSSLSKGYRTAAADSLKSQEPPRDWRIARINARVAEGM